MADADGPVEGGLVEPVGEIVEFALGPPAIDRAVDQGRDPGAVIAAIFEPPQAVEQQRRDRRLSQNADDPAHIVPFLSLARPLVLAPLRRELRPQALATPGFGCLARPPKGETASRDVLGNRAGRGDEGVVADNDRAIRTLLEPMKTSFPMTVLCLIAPS